jgi:hypothetical protein
MVNAFYCMNSLEELTLSLQHPSDFGRALFNALRAKRSPLVNSIAKQDCWRVELLPSLTSLSLRYMRGLRSDTDYETVPLVPWSRKQTASPLRELKVWAGNRNVVDYASADYLSEHFGMEECCDNLDEVVCTSTLTQELIIYENTWCCLTKFLDHKRGSLATFSRLKILDIRMDWLSSRRIALSDLKHFGQIRILRLTVVVLIPVPPDARLPLLKTLREIYLNDAPTKWISGHVFINLTTLSIVIPRSHHQEFHFNAAQARNTFPCLCTLRLLQRCSQTFSVADWGPRKLDQLVHMIWGEAEVRKTEYEEDSFQVFCAAALPS